MPGVMTPQPRLLVNAVDAKAKSEPDSPWILCAKSSSWDQEDGYLTITWEQFANAVNRAAYWLDENLARTTSERQTFAYLGPNDPSYYILIVAAAKSRRRMFIPDGRITPEGQAKILKEINCSVWISTDDKPSSVLGQKSLAFPSLEDILAESSVNHPAYPYDETWEDSKDEIVCIIHTSGTTGVPKPIYIRNGYMSVWDSWNTIMSRNHPRKITLRHMINARSLTCCSPQWLAGLAFSLNAAVFLGMTTVMLPIDMNMGPPLDRQALMRIFRHTGAESIITPPALIEDFYNDTESFNFLKSLKYVCYLGAGLDHKVGDALTPHTNLFPLIGSTEHGIRLSFESDDVLMWKSYEFVPEMGPRFELVADGVYELHVERITEDRLFQCGFYTFPEKQSLKTEELYTRTVDKFGSTRWVLYGRKDDLVKLSWLAKFHATHIENAVARHPQVAAVFVGGEGRAVPYIIIEPRDWTAVGDPEKFLDELYNTVICNVNEKDDEQIGIPRQTIMLADPHLPFKRTMKMTVIRKEVEKSYQEHIEALYNCWEMERNCHAMNGNAKDI